jgi:hypothetical protein
MSNKIADDSESQADLIVETSIANQSLKLAEGGGGAFLIV